jgi:hypothetical protein
MTATKEAQALYWKWVDANKAKTEFWTENYKKWDNEVDATYKALNSFAEDCYYEWVATKNGKTVEQVAYEINEKIHSARD